MSVGQSGWSITGSAGRLFIGSRLAATLGSWSAQRPTEPNGLWRIHVASFTPDPYWFDPEDSFRMKLNVGRGLVNGSARIVHIEEGGSLVLEVEIEHNGAD